MDIDKSAIMPPETGLLIINALTESYIRKTKIKSKAREDIAINPLLNPRSLITEPVISTVPDTAVNQNDHESINEVELSMIFGAISSPEIPKIINTIVHLPISSP